MIEHGQQWGVVVDAMFRTNEKMVIHNTYMWSNTLIYL